MNRKKRTSSKTKIPVLSSKTGQSRNINLVKPSATENQYLQTSSGILLI